VARMTLALEEKRKANPAAMKPQTLIQREARLKEQKRVLD